jgi:hypothetical protein
MSWTTVPGVACRRSAAAVSVGLVDLRRKVPTASEPVARVM